MKVTFCFREIVKEQKSDTNHNSNSEREHTSFWKHLCWRVFAFFGLRKKTETEKTKDLLMFLPPEKRFAKNDSTDFDDETMKGKPIHMQTHKNEKRKQNSLILNLMTNNLKQKKEGFPLKVEFALDRFCYSRRADNDKKTGSFI